VWREEGAPMTIFDLVFLGSVVGCGLALIVALLALVRRRWSAARRTLIGLSCYLLLYALALVSVAALSPQRALTMGQERCFDDWCLAATHATQQPTIGAAPQMATAQGRFIIVTVHVTSHAKGISQRALDVQLYLLDGAGRRYAVSTVGQRALAAAGQSGQPLDSELAPSGSFTHTAVFDIPASATQLALGVSHGAFPGAIIIGSDQSVFHRPTIIRLSLAT
jgi:hypothetical protein